MLRKASHCDCDSGKNWNTPLSAFTTAPSPDPGVSVSRVKVQRRSATEPDSAVNLPHRSPQTHTLCHRSPAAAASPPSSPRQHWQVNGLDKSYIAPSSSDQSPRGFCYSVCVCQGHFFTQFSATDTGAIILEERGRHSSRPVCRASEQTRCIWRWASAEIFNLFKHQLGRNQHEGKDSNANE